LRGAVLETSPIWVISDSIVTAGRETIGRQPGFFDVDDRLKRLSDLGDQLEAFRAVVDFEIFRPELKAVLPIRTACEEEVGHSILG
jgi:hypothetical protein